MDITASTEDRELTGREEAGELKRIRDAVDWQEAFSRDSVAFLLSILDRHKSNLLAATDRVVELERDLESVRTTLLQTNKVVTKRQAEQERREKDVRELWDAANESHEYIKPHSRLGEALGRVEKWLPKSDK